MTYGIDKISELKHLQKIKKSYGDKLICLINKSEGYHPEENYGWEMRLYRTSKVKS